MYLSVDSARNTKNHSLGTFLSGYKILFLDWKVPRVLRLATHIFSTSSPATSLKEVGRREDMGRLAPKDGDEPTARCYLLEIIWVSGRLTVILPSGTTSTLPPSPGGSPPRGGSRGEEERTLGQTKKEQRLH